MSENQKKKEFLERLQRILEGDIIYYEKVTQVAEKLGYEVLSEMAESVVLHMKSLHATAQEYIDDSNDNTLIVAKGRSKQGGYEFEIYHHEHEHKYSFRVFKDKECTKVLIDSKDIKKENYDYEGDAAEAVNAFFAGINLGK